MKLKRSRKGVFVPLFSTSDIAFLLLIFIMLLALINYRTEVKIQYPEAQTAKKVSAENNLEIWIDRMGNLYLDGDPCGIDAIEAGIIDTFILSPNTQVHIIADRDTHFAHVHQVLDILQLLNYRLVSFVVKGL